MKNILRLFWLCVCVIICTNANAEDVIIDGIVYSLDGTTASVGDNRNNANLPYNIVIPATIEHNGQTYTVTSIIDYAFFDCNKLNSVTIPNGVRSIGYEVFYGCSGLTSIVIPNSVTYIGSLAFYNCSGLTSITIPNSVTSISSGMFSGCSGLTSITIPNSVTSIDDYAFRGCTALTSVTIPNSVISIGSYVFGSCTGLTSVTIPNSVTSIGGGTFSGCSGLTSITIPNSVTSIDDYAFRGCTALTSITIPESVISIGDKAFSNCNKLTKVTLNNNSIVSKTYTSSSNIKTIFGNQVTEYNIGNSVTSIGKYAFYGCSGLISITIPNSVTSICSYAFVGCTSLTSISIPKSVTSIGNYAFYYDNNVTFITSNIKKVTLNSSAIVSQDFSNTSNSFGKIFGYQVQEYTIGDEVKAIGNYAFYGCTASVIVSDNIENIGSGVPSGIKFYVHDATRSLLTLWNYGITPQEIGTERELKRPYLSYTSTQTTATVKLNDKNSAYTYTINDNESINDTKTFTGLKPEYSRNVSLYATLGGFTKEINNIEYKTANITPTVHPIEVTPTSIAATGSYINGDAHVIAKSITLNGTTLEGESIQMSGLNPNSNYRAYYKITVAYGDNNEYSATYTGGSYIYTSPLSIIPQQYKVVSPGNAIVSAQTNIENDEETVGFEWRRTDWTSEFESERSEAYLYEGNMEGYIRNLNTDYLWKFRPYYKSAAGTYYYGEWKGLDPTNTSYFEPTVHTYAKINIDGNTALVRGYVLSGTDEVAVKGFKYWRTGVYAQTRAGEVPGNALTVEATGQQVISANLKGLEYNSVYHCMAFATTVNGETFYGDEQMFTTPLASAQYATFYDSQSAYRLPAGLTASVVTGVSNGKLVYKVIADGSKSENVLPKGVAVMLTSAKGEPDDYTMTPIESDAAYTGENWLKGSDNTTMTTGSNCLFYKLSYGHSETEQSGIFGWYWGAANGGAFKIEGHKAWLAIPKSAGVRTRAFDIEGESMGVVEDVIRYADTDAYYDLMGRKVNYPTKPGIYIHNGKKIIIK